MAGNKTVTINGRTYDAVTGLLVETPATKVNSAKPGLKRIDMQKLHTQKPHMAQPNAQAMHSKTQRPATLSRRFIKKPTTTPKISVGRPQAGRHMDIAKSGAVSKFAPHPQPVPKVAAAAAKLTKSVAKSLDRPAITHPLAARVMARQQAKKVATKPTTAKQIKDAEIAKALAAPKSTLKKEKKPGIIRRHRVLFGILVALAVLALTGYAVIRFIPSVSVALAAARADVAAKYPEYVPDGYSLSQPVSYSDGKVDLNFVSNSNDTKFVITQQKSSWDSTAVLDHVVRPKAGDNYATTKERGLTIYTIGGNAYWVNGGILYSIEGTAPLSGEQIRHIATSL